MTGSDHQDFVVNFKGETISLKNLTKLLRHHNVTLPQEDRYLAEALRQKMLQNNRVEADAYRKKEERPTSVSVIRLAENSVIAAWTSIHVSIKEESKLASYKSEECKCFLVRCDLRPRGLLISEATPRQNVTCGDVNEPLWFGVIMKSSCGLSGNPVGKDCKAAEKLNMTVQSELPVFGWKHNVTYRNIACARCRSEGNVAFWDLRVKCEGEKLNSSGSDINAVRTFVLEKGNRCSWKYETSSYQERHCVLHDIVCAANKQPWMSVVKELCSSYSMPLAVYYQKAKVSYRNPHCALCNPEGHPEPVIAEDPRIPPWSIILDVSGNFRNPKTPNTPQPTGETAQNVTAKMLHCTSNSSDCTITVVGKTCKAFITVKNQSAQMNASLDKNPVMIMQLNGSTVYVLCPDDEVTHDSNQDFTVLIHLTIIGSTLSVISLCSLLLTYLFFKELRNLPGKCFVNICGALLCYQIIFFTLEKANEVDALCKATAISLHFFVLSAFSWMSVMAFNTANAFTIKGKSKYCWISDNTAVIVAMATPVSLALVFNITCLTKNLCGIHQLQKGASLAANNSKASLTLICIKLTTVMGLTWVLGLVANWKQTEFLHYPSTLMNSMQGFFIALCFTTSKRVRGLLKESFNRGLKCAAEPVMWHSRPGYSQRG
ncbi:Latrophilin-2 [Stylophora pistillata]|uniref:Latrophilin-2 n=1 Tax=Stylophora pistillata TaxID=50429 RepID=A0A2B4S0H8_STYPI|nr:Latrophilin-2 [Stylophora pistillata]